MTEGEGRNDLSRSPPASLKDPIDKLDATDEFRSANNQLQSLLNVA